MTSDAAAVLRDALSLPDRDRASIAAELLASLPEPAGGLVANSDEWVQAIERRAREVRSGEATTESWDTVARRILDRFATG